MSGSDLESVYLTIGTRSRHSSTKTFLGEKGVGRLSVMRLGNELRVKTTKSGEPNFNTLEIDWKLFSHESDALIDEIQIKPKSGPKKDNPDYSGTTITIYDLSSSWSSEKLSEIARSEFSKLVDPFSVNYRPPFSIRYNDSPVPIPKLDELLFAHSHAFAEISLNFENSRPKLFGTFKFFKPQRSADFMLEGDHLLSVSRVNNERSLRELGPFKVTLYWYNRRILGPIDGIGDTKKVRELVAQWAGGLLVYRDGYRVYPYGGPDDDWLDLDRAALASQGYKLNRNQIIGKLDISSRVLKIRRVAVASAA